MSQIKIHSQGNDNDDYILQSIDVSVKHYDNAYYLYALDMFHNEPMKINLGTDSNEAYISLYNLFVWAKNAKRKDYIIIHTNEDIFTIYKADWMNYYISYDDVENIKYCIRRTSFGIQPKDKNSILNLCHIVNFHNKLESAINNLNQNKIIIQH